MIVLVTGGREFENYGAVAEALEDLAPDCIVQGGATGADAMARCYADAKGLPLITMRAAWAFWGRRQGGPLRNSWMLRFTTPDLVLAFPGGSGTANMVKQAKAAGLKVRMVR